MSPLSYCGAGNSSEPVFEMKKEKTAVIAAIIALFAATGVAVTSFTDPAPDTRYLSDTASLNENDEDGEIDGGDEESEDEEKKRIAQKRRFGSFGSGALALLGGLSLGSIVRSRKFWLAVLVAALCVLLDSVAAIIFPEYRAIHGLVLAALCALCTALCAFLMIRKKPAEPKAEPEITPPEEPKRLTFIDCGGEFSIELNKNK